MSRRCKPTARAAVLAFLCGVLVASSAPRVQAADDEVATGKALALELCTPCHVVAPDQRTRPLLLDPAPNFGVIGNRKNVSAESLRRFLATTHATVSNPQAMPNPQLVDYQFGPLASYILSWRNKPWSAPASASAPPATDALYDRVIKDSTTSTPRTIEMK